MENNKLVHVLIIISVSLVFVTPSTYGWGVEGHIAVCRIAQARLTKEATSAVKKLLPAYANGNLGPLCPWADGVKFRYRWSAPLHYITTPNTCTFAYARDCRSGGMKDYCLAGAINNYTAQLQGYLNKNPKYNLTEALLFMSHFVGDIHQPLHVAHASDRGGNTINVKWFNKATVLHHVWDTDIITKAMGNRVNASNTFVTNIQHKINNEWEKQLPAWEACKKKEACPNKYAAESIKAACEWAYKGAPDGSMLSDNYYNTRWPIVELRLAQAGVRLASVLNQIFTK